MTSAARQNTMNTELWQSIGAIADNQSLMQRLTRYAKRLVKEKEDPTLMSKEEFFARVDEAKKEYEEGKYTSFDNIEDMNKWLQSL